MSQQNLLISYWQLPQEIYISLIPDFHKEFCSIIQNKLNCKYKHCFHLIFNCPKWKAKRLFNRKVRFTIEKLEILREFAKISQEEIEKNIETLGNHEDGTIIRNPKLPFHLKDLFYVASHLMFDGCFRPKKVLIFIHMKIA